MAVVAELARVWLDATQPRFGDFGYKANEALFVGRSERSLATFEKLLSDQPECASVRFFHKPWASALRLMFTCDSNFSNDA